MPSILFKSPFGNINSQFGIIIKKKFGEECARRIESEETSFLFYFSCAETSSQKSMWDSDWCLLL